MYYLLGLSVLAASFNSIVLNKAQVNKKTKIFAFNLIVSLVWCIILFVVSKGSIRLNVQVLFWGIAYGITQALFVLFKTAAMSSGSVSITTLIGNTSLLISVFVSLLIWKETISVIDVLGLCLLLVSIFLCTYKKTEASYTSKWKYYAVFFLIFAAGVGIVFKAFGKSGNLEYCGDMMFVSALVMVICYLVACLFTGGWHLKNAASGEKSKFVIYAIACGSLSCLYNRLNIFLSGSMDAIIFFPVFNGGVVLLSALFSVLLCKEKLAQKQKIGLLIGIIAISVIGIL